MWVDAQSDGRPAEYRWRPLFNAAKFGWRPLLECRAVTLSQDWNVLHAARWKCRTQKIAKKSPSGHHRMYMYTDDTQVYSSCRASAVTTFTTKVSDCVEATTSWMRSNRLQPNLEKTEVLWCATARRQHQLPTSPLLIDGCSVSPVKSTRPWYPYWQWPIDADARQTYTVSRCFASLRQLRQIRVVCGRLGYKLWISNQHCDNWIEIFLINTKRCIHNDSAIATATTTLLHTQMSIARRLADAAARTASN